VAQEAMTLDRRLGWPSTLSAADALRELRGSEYLARVKVERLQALWAEPREPYQQKAIDDAVEAHALIKKALDAEIANTQ
jgi:hypothetical protein